MKFETTSTITEIGPIESFGANGFQKRNLILSEQNGEYANPVCVEFSGDKIGDPERYQVGQMVKVGGFINCREHNGNYYTSLRGSYVQTAGDVQQAPQQATQAFGGQPQAPQYRNPPQAAGVDPQFAPPQQPVQQQAPQQYQAPQQPVQQVPQQQGEIPF